uniref:Uncharacterized protein n=1 Tax=candidate division CPR3 bacterium TaxID=2268181 RepID=A0A7V3N473_UNCC3
MPEKGSLWNILEKYWDYEKMDWVSVAKELSGEDKEFVKRALFGEEKMSDDWAKNFVCLFGYVYKVEECPYKKLMKVDGETIEQRRFQRWVNCLLINKKDWVSDEEVLEEIFNEVRREDVDWKYVKALWRNLSSRIREEKENGVGIV